MRYKFSALRKVSALLVVLALAAGAPAQQQQQQQSDPSGVSAERLRAHVAHLASEQLAGRRTGTEGADLAARYIAEQFRSFNLAPAGNTGTGPRNEVVAREYWQKFPYVAAVELGKRNSMLFVPRATDRPQDSRERGALDLRLGEDWTPLAWSANGKVEQSAVVYVGYGIKAAELGHDDYAGVDVRDKVAVAFAGTPDGDNPHGQFARFSDLRFKAAAAREAGARALLVISREENFKDDKWARLRPDEGLAAGDAGLPVALISRQVARRAVEAAALPSVTFEKLEQSAAGRVEGATAGAAGTATPQQGVRPNNSTPMRNIAFSLETEVVKREAPAYNVVGVLRGSDPKLREEAVVVGAHYDHLGRGGQGSLASREGEIHHGADDNASGTAALLELARVLSELKPRRTVVFAAFGGEEEGLLGSNFYVNRAPVVPLARTVAMFNMDMIGRMKEDRLVVGGAGTAAEWRQLIERENAALRVYAHPAGTHEAARRAGDVPIVVAANGAVVATANTARRFSLTLNDDGLGPSDHASFYLRQIPVLFFWTGTHEDYHKPTDTAERINYEGLLRVTEFVRDLLRAVDASDAKPTYARAKSSTPTGRAAGGFRVYLGTIPSYAEGGDGLKLDGVREDSPAAKAGLKAGDLVVKLAGRDIKNVYDYTQALGDMKAGEEYEVEALRGGERLKLKIVPAARK